MMVSSTVSGRVWLVFDSLLVWWWFENSRAYLYYFFIVNDCQFIVRLLRVGREAFKGR